MTGPTGDSALISTVDANVSRVDVTRTVFEQIGGELTVRAMTERFYDLMEIEPDLRQLREAHGPSLEEAREKLFLFLCGYFGGPDRYVRLYGHPRLRARHLPFSIGEVERDQWVICMGRAMQDVGIASETCDRLLHAFYGTADWMRNRAG